MIEILYSSEKEQRNGCKSQREVEYETIMKVWRKEHLMLMEKQYRLLQYQQQITKQQDKLDSLILDSINVSTGTVNGDGRDMFFS